MLLANALERVCVLEEQIEALQDQLDSRDAQTERIEK